jgi:SAM-dependent methyltransferase
MSGQKFEFPEYSDENTRIWNTNAHWWDDRIGDGNDFQTLLIEPATERLLAIAAGDVILDIACGAGRFARRMAERGARVVALDLSASFIERARQRTAKDAHIDYHVLDAAQTTDLPAVSAGPFDKAVCTMALMDMPEITPMFSALSKVLKPGGAFVFSITHPCFHTAATRRFTEVYEEGEGRHTVHSGVKVSTYLSSFARKSQGILGQPEPQWFYHRPLHVLFGVGFSAGFVVDGIEEPGFPESANPDPGVHWDDMPEIPPIMVVRMRLMTNKA